MTPKEKSIVILNEVKNLAGVKRPANQYGILRLLAQNDKKTITKCQKLK